MLDKMPPKAICANMQFCSSKPALESKLEVLECAVCHGTIQALDKILENPSVDEEIDEVLERACSDLPAKYYSRVSFDFC